MAGFGHRLREERLRVGLSQDECAAVGGISGRSQSAYEKDDRVPDANYLVAVRGIGVDAWYVLTGERSVGASSTAEPTVGSAGDRTDADETELLDMYRQLNEGAKAALFAFLGTMSTTDSTTASPIAKRARRLVENRRAAMDQRAAENVERAMAELERARAERADRAAKTKK